MYQVGQVIYSILEDKQVLIPLQVIEQVITKNLEGEITQYKVLVPNRNRQKLNLDKFNKIFEDLDSASEYLLNNAKSAIDDMVLKAIELEDLNFKKEEKSQVETIACTNESKKVKIDLGEGLIANISPENLEELNIDNLQEESEEVAKEDITA